jgi:hypothetical protein
MRIASLSVALMLVVGGTLTAQVPGAAAKAAARNAVAATNAHIEAEQAVEQRPSAKPALKSATPNATPLRTVASTATASKTAASKAVDHPATRSEVATVDTAGTSPIIRREAYGYSRDARRDPFVSLLTTNELRPTMSDLRLTGILFDEAGHSVATLRDIGSNASYRVTTGATLGRMRVSVIRLKAVVFTIDEFGTTRQDSLVLGDSTKVRGK